MPKTKEKTSQNTEAVVMKVLTETVRTVPQAINLIHEATGLRPDKATICRWLQRGRQGIRLEGCKIGTQWVTSEEAITRFIVATTEKATA
jgi:hypothetical protein